MVKQPNFVFFFHKGRFITGFDSDIPKTTHKHDLIKKQFEAVLASKSPEESSKESSKEDVHLTKRKKISKGKSDEPHPTKRRKISGGESGKSDDPHPEAPNPPQKRVILRICKKEIMNLILNHEHMRGDGCHDNFSAHLDVIQDKERTTFIENIVYRCYFDAAVFLHSRLNVGKLNYLPKDKVSSLFNNVVAQKLSQYEKYSEVTIRLSCCGQVFELDRYINEYPSSYISEDVKNVNIPLMPLPPKDKNNKFIYSEELLEEELKRIYRSKSSEKINY